MSLDHGKAKRPFRSSETEAMGYPSIVMLIILLIGFISRGRLLFYLFFALSAFTSLSLLPPDHFGGFNVQAQTLAALGLFAKTIQRPGAVRHAIRLIDDMNRLGLLFFFLVVSILVSIISPNLFASTITIVPVRLEGDFQTALLSPTGTNLSQCVYLAVSILTALTFALLAMRPNFINNFVASLLFGGIVVVVSGIADMIFADSGALAPFRNTSFPALESAIEFGGTRRVIGLTPEASAYGWICVYMAAMLLFLRPAVTRSSVRLATVVVTSALIIMALLSTSSTAYLWLASLAACYMIDLAIRGLRPTPNRTQSAAFGGELFALAILIIIGATVLAFGDGVYDRAYEMLDAIIFKKNASESFYGRSFWNSTSFAAFISSWGLGVGVGGTRTSSTYIGLLSSTGVVGAILFGLFMIQIFMTKARDAATSSIITGLKLTLLSLFLPWATTGGVDFGPNVGAIFGVIIGLTAANGARARQGSGQAKSARMTRLIYASAQRSSGDCRAVVLAPERTSDLQRKAWEKEFTPPEGAG
ncbi:hypothetical protein [Methylocella tundrae]|nr:hypothetical protein [Methylocella tundrae]WPP03287.1 hypothetical protein SIN04_12435 [Methylocella tundrae]